MPSKRQFFGTDGIRGKANEGPLAADFVVRLGMAAADAFRSRTGKSRDWPAVVIGKDTRQSGDMLECAISAGLNARGVDVRLAGVVPTPAVAMLTRETGAAFGVVVSASHNPFEDNGIKFFGPEGYKLDDDFELDIERRVLGDPDTDSVGIGRTSRLENASERYVDFVRCGNDPELLSGLTIALDAANGAAFETSEAVLRSLGAKVKPFHHRPNGLNINAGCGCTHPEIIESLVRESGADLGISHDGDADRVLLCDENGSALDGDELMAIAALHMLEEGSLAKKTLVATVMSNAGLDEAVEVAGGTVVRTGVGDRYVMEEMRRGSYNLGGEQSGHFIFRDRNTTGDGIVAAVEFLRAMRSSGKPLSELRRCLTKFPQAQRNVRVARKPLVQETSFAQMLREIEEAHGSAGRVLLRYSGTEPLLRILIEGKDTDEIERQADELAAAVRGEIGA